MTREDLLQQEIEKYKRKIETYQAMIAEWEGELGGINRSSQHPNAADATDKKKESAAASPLSLIHGMVFFGKSQPEAAKAFLEMVRYPLTTAQILEGVEKGGVSIGGKNPVAKKQNLYTILNRSAEFVRVKKDTWAVVGWPGVPKKVVDEESDLAGKGSGPEVETAGK